MTYPQILRQNFDILGDSKFFLLWNFFWIPFFLLFAIFGGVVLPLLGYIAGSLLGLFGGSLVEYISERRDNV